MCRKKSLSTNRNRIGKYAYFDCIASYQQFSHDLKVRSSRRLFCTRVFVCSECNASFELWQFVHNRKHFNWLVWSAKRVAICVHICVIQCTHTPTNFACICTHTNNQHRLELKHIFKSNASIASKLQWRNHEVIFRSFIHWCIRCSMTAPIIIVIVIFEMGFNVNIRNNSSSSSAAVLRVHWRQIEAASRARCWYFAEEKCVQSLKSL